MIAWDLHITVMVVGKVDSPVSRTDPHLDRVVAIIRGLWVILEDNGLPRPRGELPPSKMHEERLSGRVGAQGAIEHRILPAVKGRDGILLECVPVYGMLPMGWISAQDSHFWIRQHCSRHLTGWYQTTCRGRCQANGFPRGTKIGGGLFWRQGSSVGQEETQASRRAHGTGANCLRRQSSRVGTWRLFFRLLGLNTQADGIDCNSWRNKSPSSWSAPGSPWHIRLPDCLLARFA